MIYSNLRMWFRVRALYLILLERDLLLEEVRDEGVKREGKALVLAAGQMESTQV